MTFHALTREHWEAQLEHFVRHRHSPLQRTAWESNAGALGREPTSGAARAAAAWRSAGGRGTDRVRRPCPFPPFVSSPCSRHAVEVVDRGILKRSRAADRSAVGHAPPAVETIGRRLLWLRIDMPKSPRLRHCRRLSDQAQSRLRSEHRTQKCPRDKTHDSSCK